MKAMHYLNFPGNTEEAFNFYRQVFGGEFAGVFRFRDVGGNGMGVPDQDMDKIMHIALPLGNDGLLMGTDALESMGQSITAGNNQYIFLDTDSADEASRIFTRLSEGGKVEMPLARTSWAELYGSFRDRFLIKWMVNYTGDARMTSPTAS